MNRRDGPTDDELYANLEKRKSSLAGSENAKRSSSVGVVAPNDSRDMITLVANPPTADNSLGLNIE